MPTKPLFCLPIVVPSGTDPHLQLKLADSSTGAHTLEGRIAAGTYYNASGTAAGSLALALKTKLQALEDAVGGGFLPGTWEVVANGRSVKVRRTKGHADDVVEALNFLLPSELPGERFGYSSDEPAPALEDEKTVFTGTWTRGYLWEPEQYVLRSEARPVRLVKSAVSPFAGDSVIHLYSAPDKPKEWLLRLEVVWGAFVWEDLAAQSGHAAHAGITAGDLNATLERALWKPHATVGPIRYYPSQDDLGTYHAIEIVGEEWLSDLRVGVKERVRSPARYDVDLVAKLV